MLAGSVSKTLVTYSISVPDRRRQVRDRPAKPWSPLPGPSQTTHAQVPYIKINCNVFVFSAYLPYMFLFTNLINLYAKSSGHIGILRPPGLWFYFFLWIRLFFLKFQNIKTINIHSLFKTQPLWNHTNSKFLSLNPFTAFNKVRIRSFNIVYARFRSFPTVWIYSFQRLFNYEMKYCKWFDTFRYRTTYGQIEINVYSTSTVLSAPGASQTQTNLCVTCRRPHTAPWPWAHPGAAACFWPPALTHLTFKPLRLRLR